MGQRSRATPPVSASDEPIVIVIDDDPLTLGSLSSLFRSIGLRVQAFSSATQESASRWLASQDWQLHGREHFIPLKDSELAEIDSWSCSDTGPWITNAAGEPMSPQAISDALEKSSRHARVSRGDHIVAWVARYGGLRPAS